jgi:hypothetical protein
LHKYQQKQDRQWISSSADFKLLYEYLSQEALVMEHDELSHQYLTLCLFQIRHLLHDCALNSSHRLLQGVDPSVLAVSCSDVR